MTGAAITAQHIRAYGNLANEVPESLLALHISIATGDLARATGLITAPANQEDLWAEALTVRALASAFPWLNTFALDGAAKVGRLEGSVEYRFLTPEDVEARVKELNARFERLVALLNAAKPDETQPGQVALGPLSMMSI